MKALLKSKQNITITTLILLIIVLGVVFYVRKLSDDRAEKAAFVASTPSNQVRYNYNNDSSTKTKPIFPQYDPKNYNPAPVLDEKCNYSSYPPGLSYTSYIGKPQPPMLEAVVLSMNADKTKEQYRYGQITTEAYNAEIAKTKTYVATINSEYLQNVDKWNAAVVTANNELNTRIVNGPRINCVGKLQIDANEGKIDPSIINKYNL